MSTANGDDDIMSLGYNGMPNGIGFKDTELTDSNRKNYSTELYSCMHSFTFLTAL